MFIMGEGFHPTTLTLKEWSLVIFFPIGVMIGMLLGWWKENIGGFITMGCLIVFYVVHYLTSGSFPHGLAFIAFSSPGIVFLLSWYQNLKIKSAA